MAFLDELQQGVGLMNEGFQKLSLQRSLAEADQLTRQIKNSEMDEIGKRRELQGLADRLVYQLSAGGIPTQTIAQVAGATAPQKPTTGAERVAIGFEGNDQGTIGQGQRQLVAESAGDLAKIGLDAKLKAEAPKPLSDAEIKAIADSESSSIRAQELLNQVIENPWLVGPAAGRIRGIPGDETGAAFKAEVGQFFDQYRVAITGAASGEHEIEELKKNTPVVTDRPATFKAKASRFIQLAGKMRTRYLGTLKKAGRDTSGFQGPQGAEVGQQAPGLSQFIKRVPTR